MIGEEIRVVPFIEGQGGASYPLVRVTKTMIVLKCPAGVARFRRKTGGGCGPGGDSIRIQSEDLADINAWADELEQG